MATSDTQEADRTTVTEHDIEPASSLAVDSQGYGLADLLSMRDVLRNFELVEEPNSVKADEDGLATAKFLIDNASLANSVEDCRSDLQQQVWTELCLIIFGRKLQPTETPLTELEKLKKKDKKKYSAWPPAMIQATMFKNWAGTAEESNGLMLYAKPKHVNEVQAIIRAAVIKGIKVYTRSI